MPETKYKSCLDAACRYLRYRPRSEFEVRACLHRKGFDNSSIDKVIRVLSTQGIINDDDFARFWMDNRESFSPRSRAMLRMELRQKGVKSDIIRDKSEFIDEEASAYRAARKRMKLLAGSDHEKFSRFLSGFLKRRGFTGDIVRQAVSRLWQEKESENA